MFKNAKTGTKALLGFGSIILISVLIIVVMLVNLNRISGTTQKLYTHSYAATNNVWSIRRDLVDMERVLNKLMSVSSQTLSAASAKANETLSADAASVDSAIASLESLFTAPEQTKMLAEIKSKLSSAGKLRKQIMDYCLAGNSEKAAAMIKDEYEVIFDQANEIVLNLFNDVEADAEQFAADAHVTGRNTVISGIVLLMMGILLACFITIVFTKSLVRPIKQLTRAADEMSKGNLKVVDHVTYHSNDELGQLADSLRTTMNNLSDYVSEISGVLLQISKGDLTVHGDTITDFLGDFSSIKSSLVYILKSFNTTLGEIRESADQVDSGSGQVSNAAQGLSSGASEQACSIQELSTTVEQISEQIRENAANAETASKMAVQAGDQIEISNQQMRQMMAAMTEISQSSGEIGKIIKTIEDIAFQTNILALNAAVEAARAGAAGKGFAVVADEVRNLASKSAEASKNTSALIASSISAVENGSHIADETAKSLQTVVESAKNVVLTVEKIADASERQAHSVELVTQSANQISDVVQNNSATAQQSAAASEELAMQAATLKELVERFRLFQAEQRDDGQPEAPAAVALQTGKY